MKIKPALVDILSSSTPIEFEKIHIYSLYKTESVDLLFLKEGKLDISCNLIAKDTHQPYHQVLCQIQGPALIPLFKHPDPSFLQSELSTIESLEIYAEGHSDTVCFPLTASSLTTQLLAGSELIPDLLFLAHSWQSFFVAELDSDNLRKLQSLYLPDEGSIEVKKDSVFSSQLFIEPEKKQSSTWIQMQSGKAYVSGYPALLLQGGYFPIYNQMLIEAKQDCTISVLKVSDLSFDLIYQGISQFNFCFLSYLISSFTLKVNHEKQRYARKKKLEEDFLNQSLNEIRAVLVDGEELSTTTSTELLVQTCQVIGNFMGVQFKDPLEKEFPNKETFLSEICRASSINYREVVLTNSWWKQDCGPLLGFYDEDQRPVALLNKKAGHYKLIDLKKNQVISVNAKIAKKIQFVAYTFYTPLPTNLKKGKDILLYFCKKHKKEFFTTFYVSIASALIALIMPFASKVIFGNVIPNNDLSLLSMIFFLLLSSSVCLTLFYFIRGLSTLRLETAITNELQSGLWDRLLRLPVSFFTKYPVGIMINRVNAVDQIHKILTGNVMRIILSGAFSLVYLVMMLMYSPKLSLLALGLLLGMVSITIVSVIFKSRMGVHYYESEGIINGSLLEIINGIGKLRVTGAENKAFTHWARLFATNKKIELKSLDVENIAYVVNSSFPLISTFIIFSGIISILTQQTRGINYNFFLGNFLGFYTAFTAFSLLILDVSNTLLSIAPVYPLWHRAKPILEESPEIHTQKTRIKLNGEIHLDTISFRYQENSPLILDNVTISAQKGEFVAIVGPSGCGKSTLLRLLLGFSEPEQGAIYLNNQNLDTLDLQYIRRQIGIVLQNDNLLSGSIKDNICCGRFFTMEQIDEALELSGFKQELKEFPMGIHTYISAGSGIISGGQKQCLLIARALIAKPKILIFDEATSALDNSSQEKVSSNIDKLNTTRLVIAHRLSTVKNADKIYVMKDGKIIDQGTFKELASRPGLFADMLAKQKL